MLSPENVNLVIYHGKCPDGFGSAWAAWSLLKDKAEYRPMLHHEEPPNVEGKNVAILDFSFKKDVFKSIIEKANDVILIDHHIKAKDDLEKDFGDYCIFDMEKSGCVLSYEYFHKDQKIPTLLRYIQDRDLFKFDLYKTDELLSYFDLTDYDFEEWTKFSNKLNWNRIEEFISYGSHIVKHKEKKIKEICEKANKCYVQYIKGGQFQSTDVMAVNLLDRSISSKVGHKLAEVFGVAITWHYDMKDDKSYCSIYSTKESNINVSEIASVFGGGGHKNAAGFVLHGTFNQYAMVIK